jgi:hypothetical protein
MDKEILKKAKAMAEKAEPLVKSTSMLEAEKTARAADKAWKAGRVLSKMTKMGKVGKALGLGAAALQIYEDWKQE